MIDAGDAMTGLARPMQHAVNNLVMVMQANMESVLATLPAEDRAGLRLARAAQAAKDMDALVRAFLRLGRAEESSPVDARALLMAMQPVLGLAVGKPLTLQVESSAFVAPRRPAVDLAILAAFAGARDLPRTTPATATLDGTRLHLSWPLPDGSAAALAEAGIGAEAVGEAAVLVLPAAG